MSVAAEIKNKYSFAVKTKCESFGCKLDLAGVGNYVVLDAEKLRDRKAVGQCQVCDHIVFLLDGKPRIFIVEQKGASSASDIPAQVEKGAKLALEIISGFGQFNEVSIYLLGLKKKWNKHELKRFRSAKIKLRGEYCYIANLRCGDSLANFIKNGKKDGVQYEGLITLN